MRFLKFGKKFFFALFFVPLICIVILSSDNTNRLAFADNKIRAFKTKLHFANVKVTQIIHGNPSAKTRIVLYLSPTCHNCAELLTNHFYSLKEIVDKSAGNICLEIKPYVGNRGDLDAVKLMYLASKSKSGLDRAKVLLAISRNQKEWIKAEKPRIFLLKNIIGRPELAKKLLDERLQYDILTKCNFEYKDYLSRLRGAGIPIIKVCVKESTDQIREYEYKGSSKDENRLKAFIRKFI